ncbi:hypothetical protein BLOT_016795 [Blomia tropicalis]|nr:hypothetical protein BLOT_016795 [Blomia tropicalis]
MSRITSRGSTGISNANELITQYKKNVLETKTKAMREYFTIQTGENVWKAVYRWTRNSPSLNQSLKTIKRGDSFTSNIEETAHTLLNTFFPDDTANNSLQNQLQREAYDLHLAPNDQLFSVREVNKVIAMENDKKAPGEDGFTANIIKNVNLVEPLFLHKLYNKCLELSVFPKTWKTSSVILIPKTGDSTSAKAFRPISLLPVLGKILEKLLNDRLMFYLNRPPHNIAHNQYGFTPHKSAEDAINAVVERIRILKNSREFATVVSLDISGAFDNMWWPSALGTLRKYRTPANIFNLVRHYFSHRTAKLNLCNQTFSKPLMRGCPQGAKCSPLFWNIVYSNLMKMDLPENCYVQAYADDAILICTHSSLDDCIDITNRALALIFEWGLENKLTFNPTKTQAMIASFRQTRFCVTDKAIVLNNTEIEITSEIKYLGVILNRKLNWKSHVKNQCHKVKNIMHRVIRTTGKQWGVSALLLKIIYQNALEPILLYACSAWRDATDTKNLTNTLLSTQRTMAIAIIRGYRTVSLQAALILSDLMPIDLKLTLLSANYLVRIGIVSAPFVLGNLQRPLRFDEFHHPADAGVIPNCSMEHAINIFTDGSKLDGKAGCALIVYEGDVVIHTNCYRLADVCTVFQAELLAILKACEWAANESRIGWPFLQDFLETTGFFTEILTTPVQDS